MLLGILTLNMAEGQELRKTKITCNRADAKSFYLTLEFVKRVETDQSWNEHFIGQVDTLRGPRLTGEIVAAYIVKSDIATRVIAGVSYHAALTDGSELLLEDIQYSANLKLFPVGFTGDLTDADGRSFKLNCEYN